MAKNYKVLVNDASGVEANVVNIQQGRGDVGSPVRLLAQRGARYEFQDELKGKGLAPDQVRVKRSGNNLHVMFDGSQKPDVVIEDFYAAPNRNNGLTPVLSGMAENGSIYAYTPQDPLVIEGKSAAELEGEHPIWMSLGGSPINTDAFVLSSLPLAAATSGGSGWLTAGGLLGAAAIGGGGGGGGGGPVLSATGTGHLATETDSGYSSSDGMTSQNKPIYTGTAPAGKRVAVTLNGHTYETTALADGTYKVPLTDELPDGTYTPTIVVTDTTTGANSTTQGTAFTVDTKGLPSANDAATIKLDAISDDTGISSSDFITYDNTLTYRGSVSNFTVNGDCVRVDLKNAQGAKISSTYVSFNETGAWLWTDTSTRDDGVYTLSATLVDASGNEINAGNFLTSVQQLIYISDHSLKAVADVGSATETGIAAGRNAVGNVLTNDTVLDAAISKQAQAFVRTGSYGTLTLQTDGSYVYVINDSNQSVNALRGASSTTVEDTLMDSFTYTVVDATGRSTTAQLAITIHGANDAPTFSGSLVAISDITDPTVTLTMTLIVKDVDGGGAENNFVNPGLTSGAFGNFGFNTTIKQWTYTPKTGMGLLPSDVEHHDLVTVASIDGSTYQTLDVTALGSSGDKLPMALNLVNTQGVTATGHSGDGDTLLLLGSGQTLDFTQASTHINHVEAIDLRGTGNNMVKLTLASLMQSDTHILSVAGNGTNGAVSTVDISALQSYFDPTPAQAQGQGGIYYFTDQSVNYELHVLNATVQT